MLNKNIKVAVGLSGGVDSAVSAYLLKSQGYEVTGVHMQCWEYSSETCKGNEDRSDAVAVCGQLGIKFKFLNFEKEYKSKVIDHFYSEYRAGHTPNPDVLCNKEIKFGLFLDWAMKGGFGYVATGHYARILRGECDQRFKLLKGVDDGKDQSYFLYRLTQEQLSKSLFPLGEMKKSEVRKVAKEQKLVVAEKAESMGICFVGEVDINKFLKREIEPRQGEVILKSAGDVIGTHEGVWFYTIGQRHGFEIKKYVGLPLYVVGKDVAQNKLIVGFYNDCLRDSFKISDIHFIDEDSMENDRQDFTCDVRIRHLGQLYKAQVTLSDDSIANVKLEESAFGVAPGQSAVFYTGDEVLGGGVIFY
ncbi:MAG: tRNA 2-thiouridine(34) synthase MnmA [Patescibacteria group bacterium]